MKTKNQVFDRITARVIEALESGTMPWRRGWDNSGGGFPHNAVTGKPYRGMNVWLLMMAAEERDLESTGWITPNQAKKFELDFKGAKTEEVVFWKRSERTDEETGKKSTFMWAKSYRVINLSECRGEGLEKLKGHVPVGLPEEMDTPDDLAIAVAKALELEVKHQGTKAFYQPTKDFICMPKLSKFSSDVTYRATLLHEAIHATGHKSRADRNLKGRFGDESYAAEELIAELGSTYLQEFLGIDMDLPNHASYIASWLKVLKNDSKAIMTAASQAQKAVDYLLQRLDIVEAPVYLEEAA